MFPRDIFLLMNYRSGQLWAAFFLPKNVLNQSSEVIELSAYQKNGLKKSLPAFNIKDLISAYNEKILHWSFPPVLVHFLHDRYI